MPYLTPEEEVARDWAKMKRRHRNEKWAGRIIGSALICIATLMFIGAFCSGG
ncbi:MAG: hypothetical protein ACOH2T_19165 [Pseudomonas sp.]